MCNFLFCDLGYLEVSRVCQSYRYVFTIIAFPRLDQFFRFLFLSATALEFQLSEVSGNMASSIWGILRVWGMWRRERRSWEASVNSDIAKAIAYKHGWWNVLQICIKLIAPLTFLRGLIFIPILFLLLITFYMIGLYYLINSTIPRLLWASGTSSTHLLVIRQHHLSPFADRVSYAYFSFAFFSDLLTQNSQGSHFYSSSIVYSLLLVCPLSVPCLIDIQKGCFKLWTVSLVSFD